jgi:hypothetical protein
MRACFIPRVLVIVSCGLLAMTATIGGCVPVSAQTGTGSSKPTPATSAASTGPTDYRSQNFLIHTDLSSADAKDLLERLETMLSLISSYWAKPLPGIIECYVVKDLKNWPPNAIPDEGLPNIKAGAGVTVTRTLGNLAKATVYAVADRGTPQHEAVHAYCGQTFGTTGPVWYSEGMAEMGQYWRKGDASVNVHDVVLDYLKKLRSTPKSLNEIVNGNEKTGDSWQNYAWRWALCHLLANNPNYAPKFRPLGLALLNRDSTSFEQVYGDMADEISFEYRFFLEHLDNGFRSDLCSWDWKKKFLQLRGAAAPVSKIVANRGWQPTAAILAANTEYEYSATGTWQTAKDGGPVNADGGDKGQGKLVGVLFKDFKLSEPFDLGAKGTLTAPSDGQLYVRCQDPWTEIGDNKGQLTFKIKLVNKDK